MASSVLIYGTAFLSSILITHLYSVISKNRKYKLSKMKKTVWIISIILPIVFISTFRYDVGTDHLGYINIYETINSLPYKYLFTDYRYATEPLFVLLNLLGDLLFSDYRGFFFLASFVTYYLIVNTLFFFEKDVSLSFGLFISYMLTFSIGLNATRQMLAVSVVLFGLRYIYNKSLFKYVITILIASLFHNTAYIGFVYILFIGLKTRINIKKYRNILLMIYTVLIISSPIITYLLLNLTIRLPFLNQYSVFVTGNFDIGLGALIFIIPLFLPIVYYRKNIIRFFPEYERLMYAAFLYIPIRYLGYYGVVLIRLVLYSEILLYIVVPITISSIQDSDSKKIIKIYYIVLLIVYYIYRFIILGQNEVYPFYFSF